MKELHQSMSLYSGDFRISIKRKWLKKWRLFETELPEAMHRCRIFLEKNPEDRLKSEGKLKKLKGDLKGILQYDITDEARVWYEVDRKQHLVRIKYCGHHP